MGNPRTLGRIDPCMPFNPFAQSSEQPVVGSDAINADPGPEPEPTSTEPAASDPADDWAAAWAAPPAVQDEPAEQDAAPDPAMETVPDEPPATPAEPGVIPDPAVETIPEAEAAPAADVGSGEDSVVEDAAPEWMTAASLWDEAVMDDNAPETPSSAPQTREPVEQATIPTPARENADAPVSALSENAGDGVRLSRGIRVDAAAFDWALPDATDADTPQPPAAIDDGFDWTAPDMPDTDAVETMPVPDMPDRHDATVRRFPLRPILIGTGILLAIALIAGGGLGARTLIGRMREQQAYENTCTRLANETSRWKNLAEQAKQLGLDPGDEAAPNECPADMDSAGKAAQQAAEAAGALKTTVGDELAAQWADLKDTLSKARDRWPDASADTLDSITALAAHDTPADADGLQDLKQQADTLTGQAQDEQDKADEKRRKAEEEERRKKEEEERKAAEQAAQQAQQQAQQEAQQQSAPSYTPPATPQYTPQYTPQPQTTTPTPQPTPEPEPEPSGSADVVM